MMLEGDSNKKQNNRSSAFAAAHRMPWEDLCFHVWGVSWPLKRRRGKEE